MLPWYSMTCSQTFGKIDSRPEGLSEEKVKSRLIKFGKNRIRRKKGKSISQILYAQVKSLLMVLLFCSVIITVAIGEYLDASILFVVIAVNIISGFFMEYKAEKAFEALEKMVVDQARVIREGQDQLIDTEEIVPGDIVVFEEGDKLPADLRIFRAVDLRINESILTGESFPSDKHSEPIRGQVSVADMENMAFSGTMVTSGSGKGIVVATGSQTEFGKISSLVQVGNEETPLQKRLDSLGKTLLIFSATLALIIFFAGLMRGEELIPLLVYIVSLTVSAVPEALPTVTTLTLAIGAIEIAKKNAIIRRLPVLETLGSIDVICSDKTGTITKNEMTIRKILLFDRQLEISGIGYKPEGDFFENGKILNPLKDNDLYQLLKTGVICNNANLTFNKEEQTWKVSGDPTEGSLLVLARKAGLPRLIEGFERIGEIPFNSQRKIRSTFEKFKNQNFLHVVGAPEVIIKQSPRILINGNVKQFGNNEKKEILEKCNKLAKQGYRLLALGYRDDIPATIEDKSEEVNDIILIGVVGMIDPPRESVQEAVRECKLAGIKPVMITGDHPLTATAISNEVGIDGELLEGAALESMDENELINFVENIEIYARTSPGQKVQIVKALKQKGHIVAITGDGVNDAPVLKAADIGISMGAGGADVTREASDMVLRDNNFATIVSAIKYGRSIYDNLKRFFMYSLLGNFDELFLVLVCFIAGLPYPLTALQILWINLITDGFSGLALAFEPPGEGVLKDPPRNPHENMLKPVILRAASYALIALIFELVFFTLALEISVEKARTMVFAFCIFFELTAIFSIRTDKLFDFKITNFRLILAVIVSVLIQIVLLFTPLRNILELVPITVSEIILIIGACLLSFILMEGIKYLWQKLPALKKV